MSIYIYEYMITRVFVSFWREAFEYIIDVAFVNEVLLKFLTIAVTSVYYVVIECCNYKTYIDVPPLSLL